MASRARKNSIFDWGRSAIKSPLLFGALAILISGCSVQFKNNPAALAAAASRFPVMGMLVLDSFTPGPIGQSLLPVIAGHATVPVLFIKLYSDPGCNSLVSAGNELNFQSGMGFSVAANTTTTIYARGLALDGSTATDCTVMATYTNDILPPVVTIVTPAAASYVTAVNQAALVFSGACSENGRPVTVSGSYSGSTTCAGGAYSFALDVSTLPDGALSFQASQTDLAGNSGQSATIAITKATNTPTVAITAPAAGAFASIGNVTAFSLSGTCSENGQVVTLSGAGTGSAVCGAGVWSTTLDLSAAAQGAFTIKADHVSAASVAALQNSRSFTKDTVLPTVAITSPAAASYINSATAAAFTLSGTCSENTRTVSISGPTTATATCTTGAWSTVLDLSLTGDGALTLRADLTDAAGNSAIQSTRAFTKISNPGGADSISIAAGAAYTNVSSVGLTLSSANYHSQMYITNTAGCASGGVWEAFATSKAAWTLGQSNAVATVYVKFQDAAGNVSACTNDTIIHDNTVPTVAITSPLASSYVNAANVAAFTVSGTCSEVGRTVTIAGAGSSTATCSGGNTWSANLDLSAAGQGAVPVTADLNDAAGNSAVQSTRSFTKDTALPTVTITSPASLSYVVSSGMATFTLSGTCSENGENVILSGAAGATVACAGGGFSQTFDLSALGEGSFTFKADHMDSAGNAATQTSRSFTKDTVAPTVAITSPAGGAYVNSANVSSLTVSGTCSENGRNVTFTGAAMGSTTCGAGVFSTSLDFSSAAQGAITLNADHSDAAGNTATQSSAALTKDTVAPTLSIGAPSSATVANSSGSFTYTVTVSGSSSVSLAAGDVSLNTTGGATCTKTVTNGTTASVTITLSNCLGAGGTVGITLAAGVALDAAGNSSAVTGPSGTSTVTTAPFTQTWPFDFATTSSYTYDSTKMDFTGGVCRLTGSDQVDDDNTATGFAGGSLTGVAWDATNGYLRLSQTGTPTNAADLDSSWTPQWSQLIGYWKLSGTGNIANGSTITAMVGTTGTAINTNGTGMSYQAGQVKNSVAFDGVDDYIDFGGDVNAYDLGTSSQTVAFWAKFTNPTVNYFVTKSLAGSSNGRWFIVFGDPGCGPSSGTIGIYMFMQSGGTNYCSPVAKGYNDGNWHHIVGVWDRSANMNLYVDGVLRGALSIASQSAVNLNSVSPFYIGQYGNAAGNGPYVAGAGAFATGSIEQVAIWHSPLSAAEVSTLYSRQSAKYSGTLTSRVMDALSNAASWTTLSWVPTLPYSKELTTTNETQANYSRSVNASGTSGNSALATGLVGLWHLNEAAGTAGANTIIDSTGNNSGTPTNVTLGTTGILSGAALFNGTNSSISFPNSISLAANSFTTTAWFRSNPSGGYAYQILFDLNGKHLIHLDSPNLHARICIVSCSIGTAVIGDNRWHFVAVEGDSTSVRVYIDGNSAPDIVQAPTNTSMTGPGVFGMINGGGNYYFKGQMDEVGLWSRALDPNEILQLFRRGVNRIKYQARVCTANDCSDDSAGANWKGPDGTNQTYFSELYNMSTQSSTPSGTVQTGLPSMLFSNFTSPVGTSRYFQYRTILESDDTSTKCDYGSGATWCSPELKSVTIDPVHYDTSSPTVVGHTGVSFYSLANLTETLGASCASGISYNLGVGAAYSSATWYWWDAAANAGSGGWVASDGTVAKSNPAATITTNASTFGSTVGTSTVHFKAFLNSSGTSKCELDNLGLSGQQ
jgi:hypothetical protein